MIRISPPDEYIKYPRPWIVLTGQNPDWKDQIGLFEDQQGTLIDFTTHVARDVKWEMLALWSCEVIVFWFGCGEYKKPFFELGSHIARYFTSAGKTAAIVIGIEPEYLRRKEIESQVNCINEHIEGYPKLSIVYSIDGIKSGIEEQLKEIQGKVQNSPICGICYKTVPCEHVMSYAQVLAKKHKLDEVDPKNLA